MPGIITPPHITSLDRPSDVMAQADYLRELNRMARFITFLNVNGGVDSGTRSLNIDGVWVAYTSNATPNTEDTVAHNLGRPPLGCFQGIPNAAVIIYASATAWTKTAIYLKASVASVTTNLFLF